MSSFESKCLRDCPNDFKTMFYRGYIDAILVLFSSPDHADKFREYLSSKHSNIKSSTEKEEDGCLPFLVKTIYLQPMSIETRPSSGFIPNSEVLFLKHIKSVFLNYYYFGVSVCVLILSKFIMILII